MNILTKEDEWPQELYYVKTDFTMREELKDKSIISLIGLPMREFMKQGIEPTHLILGPREKDKFYKEFWSDLRYQSASKITQLYGLTVIWAKENQLTLLASIPQ